MTPKHHSLMRPFALAATVAMAATAVTLALGAEVALAADYQDANGNVCEGNGTFAPTIGCPKWGEHVKGMWNVAMGPAMMTELTTGNFNVALGVGALFSNTTGSSNIAIGTDALFSNTTGEANVAIGTEALRNNTEGHFNLASGSEALERNTTGTSNVALGVRALKANTTGAGNIASGTEALFHNNKGNFNIASGIDTLFSNTEGTGNIATGFEALFSNTTGVNNLVIGNEALRNNTGSTNIALGNAAGLNLTTGSNNIDIANAGVAAESGKIRIGTTGKQTAAFLAGVYKAASPGPLLAVKVDPNGQLVTAKSSSARFKQEVRGLGASAARVLSLRPVSYRYKPQFAQGQDQLQYGLIAEQVARLFPSLVQYEANGKPGGVYYEELPVLLLAQLQREHARASRQQHEIDQLASELVSLRAEIQAQR